MNTGFIVLWSGYFFIGFILFISLIHLLMRYEERITDIS